MNQLPDENEYAFYAIVNSKIEFGRLLNALGHMTAGLAGKMVETDEMCFLEYVDADGGVHDAISHFPFIALKAKNSNQVRKIREACQEKNIPFTDFTSTMTIGSSEEQLKATKEIPEAELEYFGLVCFGKRSDIQSFTKRLSLFR